MLLIPGDGALQAFIKTNLRAITQFAHLRDVWAPAWGTANGGFARSDVELYAKSLANPAHQVTDRHLFVVTDVVNIAMFAEGNSER